MTTPNLPAAGTNFGQYFIPANLSNGVTGGLADFSGMTREDWEALIEGDWNGKLLPLGDPLEIIRELVHAVTSALTGDFDPFIDLIGEVPILGDIAKGAQALLQGVIPIGWLSTDTPNLLANPDFDGADSMVVGEGWLYDAAVGRTKAGSARFTGAGVRGLQQSTPVQVAEGQELDAEVWAKWSGVATSSSAAAWKLAVRWWDGETMLAETVIASKTSPAASSDWVKLSGSATTPAGATLATLTLITEDVVTAGSIWWDDAALRKPATSIPQQWVTGLLDALGNLGDWIEHLIDQALTALGIPSVGEIGDRIGDFADAIGDLLGLGEDNAAGLDTLLDKLLHDPAAVLGSIPKAMVAGLESALAGIDDFVQDLIDALLRALRGIPVVGGTLADIISDLGGLKDTTETTQQQVSTGLGGQAITVGVLDDMAYHLVSYTSVGTTTWTPAAHVVPTGYEVDHYLVTVYGGGTGGARSTDGGTGGQGGGRICDRISPTDAGTSQTIIVGQGGAGCPANSTGLGSDGGVSKFGNLVVSVPGTSAIPTIFGDLASSAAPGSGGDGGLLIVVGISANTGSTSSTGSHSHSISHDRRISPGGVGESSSGAAGGSAGIGDSGYWGSVTPAGNGAHGITKGNYTTGGAGGGGGGAVYGLFGQQRGGNGGAPGGGGGGAGDWNAALGQSAGAGGNGGRGQVDVCAMFRPVA
ncbi:hypothetical protein nbrc107696_06140 [Gordonia spumicola]|uniref:Glycine-rich domain-containing protein n=1 Tax=Gordonia spumicola TaxID=589161 RepID=A0A7I9V412_9ACTN|nr:hypothetical protein [Gordonia spumicola]GEE00168.1 hypothetical protein nbrc107696_06140 [Gordonia spumicola]